VFSHIGRGGAVAAWGCDTSNASAPAWLQSPQKMHWVGALYAPGTLPSEAFRSYSFLKDFDSLAYIPEVTADDLPATRPVIPARRARCLRLHSGGNPALYDAAVEQIDRAVSLMRIPRIVSHHADRRSTLMELAQKPHHGFAVL
jgi:hypothetical protein